MTGWAKFVVLNAGEAAMFKWSCLIVAVVAGAVIGWMMNDVRLELKRAGKTLNEHLPVILERVEKGSASVHEHLPDIVEKTRKSTDTLAELSDDVRQLKELAGLSSEVRDTTLVTYADSVLDFVENSGGTIGSKKVISRGLADPLPAREWCVGARKKAVLLTAISKSRSEFLTSLCDKTIGGKWYVQFDENDPVMLLDWIRANHPESKELE